MRYKLAMLKEEIEKFQVEDSYEPADFCRLLGFLKELCSVINEIDEENGEARLKNEHS